MSQIVPGIPSALRRRGCVLQEDFFSPSTMAEKRWTLVGAPTVNKGIVLDGVAQSADCGTILNDVRSVSFWVTLATNTEDILQLSATHSIEAGAGTLTATGWTAPIFMVNGVVTDTITTARSYVTITTTTPFVANDIKVGEVAAFGAFLMEDLTIFNTVLVLQEALDSTNNATFSYRNKPTLHLPMDMLRHDPTGATNASDVAVNGTFSAWADPTVPDSWTKGGTFNATNYVEKYGSAGLRMVSDGTYLQITQTVLTAGRTYRMTCNCVSNTGSGITFQFGSAVYGFSTTGVITVVITATVSGVLLIKRGGATDTTITDLKVYEYTPQALDISGNNHHAVFGAGAAAPTKLAGRGYYYDGTSSYSEITGYTTGTEFAILFYLSSLDTSTATSHFIFDSETGPFWIGMQVASPNLLVNDGTLRDTGFVLIGDHLRHSIVVHKKATGENLVYVDGELVYSAAGTARSLGGLVSLGKMYSASGKLTKMNLYDFQIIDGPIIPTQVWDYHVHQLAKVNKI